MAIRDLLRNQFVTQSLAPAVRVNGTAQELPSICAAMMAQLSPLLSVPTPTALTRRLFCNRLTA